MIALAEILDVAKKKAPKTVPVRLTEEAVRWAKRASGLTEESVAEYVSRIVCERSQEDFDRLSETIRKERAAKGAKQ